MLSNQDLVTRTSDISEHNCSHEVEDKPEVFPDASLVPSEDDEGSAEILREPPNGGLKAWLTVVAGFCLYANSWGLMSSFGVFQTFYETSLLSHHSSSSISWIGSIQSFLSVFVGMIAGPLFDRGYLNALSLLGCFLTVFGMMMTSLATKYWEVLLAQGIVVGTGAGLCYIPAVALISTQFTTKRPLAVGCASTGSSMGGIIFPIMFRRLQTSAGFDWAVRAIAFTNLALALGALAIFAGHKSIARPAKSMVDVRAFREIAYISFICANFLIFVTFYIPPFYIPLYAIAKLNTSSNLAFYLVSVVNGAALFGRTIPFLFGQRLGVIQILVFWTFAAVILLLAWIRISSLPGFIVFCCIWGFINGILVAAPVVVGSHPVLSPTLADIGTRMGMCWGVASFGVLIGTPIAGALADIQTKDFLRAQIFSGVIMFAGGLCLLPTWFKIWKYNQHQV